jgi:hypothetical protein
MAVREGLALANDLALQRFRIASDNARVVKSISGSASGHCGRIVQEIKAWATAFATTKFAHEGSLFDEVGRHLWLVSPAFVTDTMFLSNKV